MYNQGGMGGNPNMMGGGRGGGMGMGMNNNNMQQGGMMNNRGGGMGGGRGMGMGGGMGGGRGGGMGGGRGGSDTLYVRVNDAVHPINENVLTKVFEPIAPIQQIQMLPPPGPNTAAAIVRFGSPQIATQCKNARDGREIYGGCCQMQINFSSWENQQQGGGGNNNGGGGGLLGGGQQQGQGGMGMNNNGMGGGMGGGRGGYNNNNQGMMNNGGGMGGGMGGMNNNMQGGGMGGMGMNNGMGGGMGRGGYNNGMGGGMMNNNGMGRGGMGGMMNNNMMGGGMNPMGGQMGGMGRGGYNNGMGGGMGFGGGGMMMGGRGGMMNNNMMMGGGRGGMGGMMNQGMGMMQQNQGPAVPNPYVSAAMLTESCPLIYLFNLLECWGTVMWCKRNFNKKKIVVIKMASNQDANAVSMHLKNIPFYDAFLSGRTFPQFNERGSEPTDEGDASNPETLQFNFASQAHRTSAWRSKVGATFCAAVGNFSNPVDEDALTNYLKEINVQFQSISRDATDSSTFNVVCNDIANAVKLVALGQHAACKDEKAQTKFIEAPAGATPIGGAPSEGNQQQQEGGSSGEQQQEQEGSAGDQQQQGGEQEQQQQESAPAGAEASSSGEEQQQE